MDLFRYFRWVRAALLAGAMVAPSTARADSPAGPSGDRPGDHAPPQAPPYFVILDAPADLNALLQKVRQPDLEVRRVDRPRPTAAEAPSPPPWMVEAVRVRGRVRGDWAALTVELVVATAGDGPTWVPIRLDGQRLIDAREGSRALGLRMSRPPAWEVELTGRGSHRVAVELRCPLTIRPARAALSLAVPEAPSTALELDFDRREPDLIVGEDEVYGQARLEDGRGWRLSAPLSPRPRIEASWGVDAGPGGAEAPLLTAQGDIAIDVDPEQVRTRSSWVVRCIRGVARELQVDVPDPEEITEVRLDDQEAEPRIERGRGSGRLTIPMAEPMRPGGARRLALRTRRALERGSGGRITFRGFPVVHAREQSGAIGVTQGSDLWVAPASSRGLRRIPAGGLPQELRERPGISLAFEFVEQPFELGLDVEPSPPLVRSRSRTQVHIEGDRARVEATIELQWVRGRPFDLALGLGPGLEGVSVGPPSVVEAWNPTGGGEAGPRGLTIRLAPPVRDQSLVILQLEAVQRLPRSGPVELGLFAPDEATAVASSFSVTAGRGVSVELDEEAASPERAGGGAFRLRDGPAERPSSSPAGDSAGPGLVVEAVGSPRVLPVRIARRARSLGAETVVSARVAPQMLASHQRTTLSVRDGTLDAVDLRVPAALGRAWELTGPAGVVRQGPMEEPGGTLRYRLVFPRPVSDRVTLQFARRSSIRPGLDAAGDRALEVAWISVPEATPGPARVELAAAPGVVLGGVDPSWTREPVGVAADPGPEPSGPSYVEEVPGEHQSFRFSARALEPVAMPAVLVPRLLIRTGVDPDEAVRCRAWYWVESHGPDFPFAPPEGARIVAARVDGRVVERVDFERGRGAYRLALPPEVAGRPALVELEYQIPAEVAGARWQPPRLLDGGVVLQTLWEARVPWDRTLLGVPRGWGDENEWDWGGNLWVRRPTRDAAALARWLLGGGAGPASAAEDLREPAPEDSRPLVFSRMGDPTVLDVWIVSRAWLVAACSGLTLLIGSVVIFARLRFRTLWALSAGLALLAASALRPSLTAQLVQSSLVGAALALLGALIQYLIDRRRSPAARPIRDPGSGLGSSLGDSSIHRTPIVGSDDPTAIRVRTPSTLDYLPTPVPGAAGADESRSSTLGRA